MSGLPAIFLDRDGTLNEEVNYLHSAEDPVLIPGVATAVARLNARGIPVVVVTNQSGIGAGRRAGCHVALVRTGYGKSVEGSLADLVAGDLPEAVDRILETWS